MTQTKKKRGNLVQRLIQLRRLSVSASDLALLRVPGDWREAISQSVMIAAPVDRDATEPGAQTKSEICRKISNITELRVDDAEAVLDALQKVAVEELRRSGAFQIPALVEFKVLNKAARPAQQKKAFGKQISTTWKPAKRLVKSIPMTKLQQAVNTRS